MAARATVVGIRLLVMAGAAIPPQVADRTVVEVERRTAAVRLMVVGAAADMGGKLR